MSAPATLAQPASEDLHTPPPDDAIDMDDEFGDASGGDDDDGGASDSDAPSSTRDDATPRPPATPATAPGLTGAKGDAMARAFAKVMAADSRSGAAAVLASSKSVAKRAADGAGEAAVDAAARKLRKEMRRRGHATVHRRGDDPAHDAREKALSRIATRGVVQLFNAISKAQRESHTAEVAGRKRGDTAAAGRAAFLAALRGERSDAAPTGLPPGARAAASDAAPPATPGGGGDDNDSDDPAAPATGAPGWDVLRDDYDHVQGGKGRLKAWDVRDSGAGEGPVGDALAESSSSDDDGEGGGGW